MRGEVFSAAYRWDGWLMTSLGEPAVGAPGATLVTEVDGPVTVVGNGGVRYAGVWAGTSAEVVGALESLAASAARLAASPAWPAVSPHALRPVYVRRPDVELARDRRAYQA
jgi:tRNA A37 threonylcarbamoyladenosine modification protein TsaB